MARRVTATNGPAKQLAFADSGAPSASRISILLECDSELRETAVRRFLEEQDWSVQLPEGIDSRRHCDIWLYISSEENRTRPLMPLRRPKAKATIVVASATMREELIAALDQGADDFLTLPIDPTELSARLRALARRLSIHALSHHREDVIEVFAHVLDADSSTLASRSGKSIQLSSIEFEVLRALAQSPRRILSRSQVIDLAYGMGASVSDRVVDYHICKIREKISACGLGLRVTTRRGRGYVLEYLEDEATLVPCN